MNNYATIGVGDMEISTNFYDATLETIGWRKHARFPGWCGYSEGGEGEGFVLWICRPFNGEPATAGNGSMIGFAARSRAEVDMFYQKAIDHGAADEGAPGLRRHYGPHWYAAYLRDPDGNKIAVVFDR